MAQTKPESPGLTQTAAADERAPAETLRLTSPPNAAADRTYADAGAALLEADVDYIVREGRRAIARGDAAPLWVSAVFADALVSNRLDDARAALRAAPGGLRGGLADMLEPFLLAAQARGLEDRTLLFRHLLRNALAPVLVPITFGIADAILIESGLSYLGFGASPPNPSWGTLLKSGRLAIQEMWWLILFPGLAIFLTVLAYNLIGEGLQEATDPRLKQSAH